MNEHYTNTSNPIDFPNRLQTAARQALAYMDSVGEQDMYPEEWAIAEALRAALEQEPIRLQCVHCGTVYAEGVPPAVPEHEPVACFIGIRGSAFDAPTTKRAYTYAEQPGNVAASKLGKSLETAKHYSAGDSIDAGLGLLKALQAEGFGVFQLGAEYTHPPRRETEQMQAAVEAEREACAKACDALERKKFETLVTGGEMTGFGARDCADAIRARGQA